MKKGVLRFVFPPYRVILPTKAAISFWAPRSIRTLANFFVALDQPGMPTALSISKFRIGSRTDSEPLLCVGVDFLKIWLFLLVSGLHQWGAMNNMAKAMPTGRIPF
jgi:hypothetical protein